MSAAPCERIAGIREDLPPGERVLWQGRPQWRSHARQAFHVREVALYFALLCVLTAYTDWRDGHALLGAGTPLALGALACLLLCALAWASSRTTIYAITTRRVFLRIGIALPLTINLPLRRIVSASLALHGDGSGDLPLHLETGPHLAFLHLWPHARPWRLRDPEPMLRGVADPQGVARILADALLGAHGEFAAGAIASAPAATPAAAPISVPASGPLAPEATPALQVRRARADAAGARHGLGAAA
jgi:hypothetical protein